MGMVDSQPHSSSNRASVDGISYKEEEEVEAPELVPPAEATLERTLIQKPIFVLLKNRLPGASPTACGGEGGPLQCLNCFPQLRFTFFPFLFSQLLYILD